MDKTKKATKAARMTWNAGPMYVGSVPCTECGAAIGEGCANGRKTSHTAHPSRRALHLATYDDKGQPRTVEAPAPIVEEPHQEEARPAFTTPHSIACPRCKAAMGAPCKTYLGGAKPACPERRLAMLDQDATRRTVEAKASDQVTRTFRLESPPDQLSLGLGAYAGPCVKPARPVAQAQEPAPLFGKVAP